MKKDMVKKILDVLDEDNQEAVTEWIYTRAVKGLHKIPKN